MRVKLAQARGLLDRKVFGGHLIGRSLGYRRASNDAIKIQLIRR